MDASRLSPARKSAERAIEAAPRAARAPRLGYLVANGETAPVPFAVREFRETSAVIVTGGWLGLPDRFFLHVDPDGVGLDCAIAWKRGDCIGITYSGMVPHRRIRAVRPSPSIFPSGTIR